MSKYVKTKEPPCAERYAQWCERSKYLIHKMRYFSYSIYLTKLLDPLVSSERIAPGVIIKEMRFYIECD